MTQKKFEKGGGVSHVFYLLPYANSACLRGTFMVKTMHNMHYISHKAFHEYVTCSPKIQLYLSPTVLKAILQDEGQ